MFVWNPKKLAGPGSVVCERAKDRRERRGYVLRRSIGVRMKKRKMNSVAFPCTRALETHTTARQSDDTIVK